MRMKSQNETGKVKLGNFAYCSTCEIVLNQPSKTDTLHSEALNQK